MILMELFWAFFQIALFSVGGGYAAMPLIRSQVVQAHGWMTMSEFADLLTIAEMTPGPIQLNAATFAGMRVAGIPGALMANLGVLAPTLTLTLAVAACFERFRKSRGLTNILSGVRPVCLGLILAVLLTLLDGTVFQAGALHWQSLLIAVVGGVLMLKWKWSVPKVIAVSAMLGLVLVR